MIALQETDYTRSRFLDKTRWEARLSDGSLVLGDDDNPEYEERSAWLRLQQYINMMAALGFNINIESIRLRFRDNVVDPLPHNADGYLIRSGIIGTMDGMSKEMIIIGIWNKHRNEVYTENYYTPELILMGGELRNALDDTKVGPSLIKNYD